MWIAVCAVEAKSDWSNELVEWAVAQGITPIDAARRPKTTVDEHARALHVVDSRGEKLFEVRRLRRRAREIAFARAEREGVIRRPLTDRHEGDVFEVHAPSHRLGERVASHLARVHGGEVREWSPPVADDASTTTEEALASERYVPEGALRSWLRVMLYSYLAFALVGLWFGVVFVLETKGLRRPTFSRSFGLESGTLGTLGIVMFALGFGAAARLAQMETGFFWPTRERSVWVWWAAVRTWSLVIGFGLAGCYFAVDVAWMNEASPLIVTVLLAAMLLFGFDSRFGDLPSPKLGFAAYSTALTLFFLSLVLFAHSTWSAGKDWVPLLEDRATGEARFALLPDDELFLALDDGDRRSYLGPIVGPYRSYRQPPELGTSLTFDERRSRVWMTHEEGARITYFPTRKHLWFEIESPEGHAFGITLGERTLTLAHSAGLFRTDPDDDAGTFERLPFETPRGAVSVAGSRWLYVGQTAVWLSRDRGEHFERFASGPFAAESTKAWTVGERFVYLADGDHVGRFDAASHVVFSSPCVRPRLIALRAENELDLAIGCAGAGVFVSRDGGASFRSWGMQGVTVTGLAFADRGRRVLVSTDSLLLNEGIFERFFDSGTSRE